MILLIIGVNNVFSQTDNPGFDLKSGIESDYPLAIIDSGVNYLDEQLKCSLWINKTEKIDGIDNDGNGIIDDVRGYDFFDSDPYPFERYIKEQEEYYSHGTYVASIVNNFSSSIPIMALNTRNNSPDCDKGCYYYKDIFKAMEYAGAMNVPIVNMSLGLLDKSGLKSISKITKIIKKYPKTLFLIAAGNSSQNLTDVHHNWEKPRNLMVIGSLGVGEDLSSISNFGNSIIDLYVLGDEVEVHSVRKSNLEKNQIVKLNGTSLATPKVASFAYILSSQKNFTLRGAELKSAVMSFKQSCDSEIVTGLDIQYIHQDTLDSFKE